MVKEFWKALIIFYTFLGYYNYIGSAKSTLRDFIKLLDKRIRFKLD